MLKRLVMPHPVYAFDMVITYDGDSLSIHNVKDTEGLPVELCQDTRQAILDTIDHACCEA